MRGLAPGSSVVSSSFLEVGGVAHGRLWGMVDRVPQDRVLRSDHLMSTPETVPVATPSPFATAVTSRTHVCPMALAAGLL